MEQGRPAGFLTTGCRRNKALLGVRMADLGRSELCGEASVAKRGAFWHSFGLGGLRDAYGCGCSSVVEHDLAKVGVEGSNPFARSNQIKHTASLVHCIGRPRQSPFQRFFGLNTAVVRPPVRLASAAL
jgi:hypothetical protein